MDALNTMDTLFVVSAVLFLLSSTSAILLDDTHHESKYVYIHVLVENVMLFL